MPIIQSTWRSTSSSTTARPSWSSARPTACRCERVSSAAMLPLCVPGLRCRSPGRRSMRMCSLGDRMQNSDNTGRLAMRMTWRFDRKRRRFLQKAGAAAATVTLAPLLITERTIAQTRTLYVNSWGGSFTAAQDAAYFKPFTAETGIHIRTVTPVSYAKIKAQVQAGRYEFDMTSINSMQWLRASREGLAEPIDWTIFKKGTLPAEAIVANGHGVASNIQGTNLCYRRDKFLNGGPRSWADFWDVKQFPGTRGLCINDSPRTLIFALLADGVPADRLYPLDIDRAFKKLDQIKPHIKVWWREGNQSQQLIRDGELDMMSIWNGRASELKEAGVPVELIWNGAVRSTSTWCVLKGAPNRKLRGNSSSSPRNRSPRPSSTGGSIT